jgi:hypothetical protein
MSGTPFLYTSTIYNSNGTTNSRSQNHNTGLSYTNPHHSIKTSIVSTPLSSSYKTTSIPPLFTNTSSLASPSLKPQSTPLTASVQPSRVSSTPISTPLSASALVTTTGYNVQSTTRLQQSNRPSLTTPTQHTEDTVTSKTLNFTPISQKQSTSVLQERYSRLSTVPTFASDATKTIAQHKSSAGVLALFRPDFCYFIGVWKRTPYGNSITPQTLTTREGIVYIDRFFASTLFILPIKLRSRRQPMEDMQS